MSMRKPIPEYFGCTDHPPMNDEDDLVYRLRKRAEIRRQISTRKSVIEGKPDRIADLLEEAADRIDQLMYEKTNELIGKI